MLGLSMLSCRRTAWRLASLAVSGLAAVVAPAATAHADESLSYPAGCSIASVGLTEPNTCSYVAVTTTEQIATALDLGVLSASTAPGCALSWTNGTPGVVTQTQTPGCTYTLTLNDPGVMVAVPDPSSAVSANVGGCADVGVACTYTALRSTGVVVLGTAAPSSSMTATVRDTATGAIASNCVAAGVATANFCTYAEVPGHSYLLSYTSGSVLSSAVSAALAAG